jgi:hypothetical protein
MSAMSILPAFALFMNSTPASRTDYPSWPTRIACTAPTEQVFEVRHRDYRENGADHSWVGVVAMDEPERTIWSLATHDMTGILGAMHEVELVCTDDGSLLVLDFRNGRPDEMLRVYRLPPRAPAALDPVEDGRDVAQPAMVGGTVFPPISFWSRFGCNWRRTWRLVPGGLEVRWVASNSRCDPGIVVDTLDLSRGVWTREPAGAGAAFTLVPGPDGIAVPMPLAPPPK